MNWKNRSSVRLSVVVSSIIASAVAGCAGAPTAEQPAEDAAPQSREAGADQPVEFDRAMRLAVEERLHREVHYLDGAIRAYFNSDQRTCSTTASSCAEPWHGVSDEADGEHVRHDDKVFPGGVNQTLVLTPKMPTGGEFVALQPVATDHLQATLALLDGNNDALPETSPFRYTYKTNGETGSMAEATLTAEADFNPDSPERHTLVVRFHVEPKYGNVRVQRGEVENAFE